MTIIDEKKPPEERGGERVQSSSLSVSATSSAPSYSPLPKFESSPAASSSKPYNNYNRNYNSNGYPQSESHCTCQRRRGFTYPGVIAYTTNILTIFAILIFSAYVVKSYEALQSTVLALNQMNDNLARVLEQEEANKLVGLVDVCRDTVNPMVTQAGSVMSAACKALPAMLGQVEDALVPNQFLASDTATQTITDPFGPTNATIPSFTSTSTSVTISSLFLGSSTPDSTSTVYISRPSSSPGSATVVSTSSSDDNAKISFGVIVGGVGAVVVMLGITGGIIYERAARSGWKRGGGVKY